MLKASLPLRRGHPWPARLIQQETPMRVMVLVKATDGSEKGFTP
jgi:hypothetical protein